MLSYIASVQISGSGHRPPGNLFDTINSLLGDPAGGNLLPQATSSAVNVGVVIPRIADRAADSAADIRAFERAAVPWRVGPELLEREPGQRVRAGQR